MSQNIETRILVVDDDLYVLETIALILREQGYSCLTSSTARDALSIMSREVISLVLSDIKMPGMTGLDLLAVIHEQYPSIPVILMTAYAELDTAINAIKKGAFDFMTKPCRSDQIYHAVDKALQFVRLTKMEKERKYMLEETVRKRTEEVRSTLESIQAMSIDLISRLCSLAEYRDPETGAHTLRMGLYASTISKELGMSSDFIENIMFAATLHDIGKIDIPDKILLKAGPLTSDEFEIMKQHTISGEQILSGSDNNIIQLAASIALNHHERWDGTGYPRGLRQEDIPLEGRIVIFCDLYDALRSKRCYKPSFTHEEALKIIMKGDSRTSPSFFDPAIREVFAKLAPDFDLIFNINKD